MASLPLTYLVGLVVPASLVGLSHRLRRAAPVRPLVLAGREGRQHSLSRLPISGRPKSNGNQQPKSSGRAWGYRGNLRR